MDTPINEILTGNREKLAKTPRCIATAKDLLATPFKKVPNDKDGREYAYAFVPYSRKDTSDGKPTAEFRREFAAIGAALTDLGVTRRSTDPKKNWKNLRINKSGKNNVSENGKIGAAFVLYYTPPVEKTPKTKTVRTRKAKTVQPTIEASAETVGLSE